MRINKEKQNSVIRKTKSLDKRFSEVSANTGQVDWFPRFPSFELGDLKKSRKIQHIFRKILARLLTSSIVPIKSSRFSFVPAFPDADLKFPGFPARKFRILLYITLSYNPR